MRHVTRQAEQIDNDLVRFRFFEMTQQHQCINVVVAVVVSDVLIRFCQSVFQDFD